MTGSVITVVGEALVDLMGGTAYPGGGPANIALGLARLGLSPVLLTHLGDDRYGALVREHLAGNGVRVVPVGPPAVPTSTASARLDAEGRPTFEFEMEWRVAGLEVAAGSRALHVGSIGLALEPGATEVRRLAERVAGTVLVSYDPNVRPAITPDLAAEAARVDRVATVADLVKLSADDLRLLYGDTDPVQVARRWLYPAGRARLVVVTLGADGALAVTLSDQVRVPGYRVDLVDTVGAGDTFQAGLLAALDTAGVLAPEAIAGLDAGALPGILRTAVGAAALACTRAGADPPTAAELAAFLAADSSG